MNHYASMSFWSGVADRAIKTFAQSLLASIAVGMGLLQIDWAGALSIAGTAVLVSVLTSLADPRETDRAVATDVEPPAGGYTARHAG